MAKQHTRVELYRQITDAGTDQVRWTVERDPDDSTASAAYTRHAIAISHGRGAEQGEPTPSSAALTFKGHTHNPENPASALYGLIGLNTPIRISTGEQPELETTFGYVAASGWAGTGALNWTLSGGTVPGDYSVTGGEGVMTHTDTNVLRHATVDTADTDHRVRVIFDTAAPDITGAGVSVWILGRFTDVNNYYAALVSISTGEVMTVALYKRVAGVLTQIAAPVTVPLTGVGGGDFDMYGELYVEGRRLYASVWRRFAGAEPLTWMVSAEDGDLTAGTRAGVTGRRETGNTNANLQLRYHEFAAIPGTIRFCGEVADWRPRRSPGGDRWVEVEAGDPLLRLQAPQAPALRSALWRENLAAVAFWPINDGADAPYAASALPGGTPMSITAVDWTTGTPEPLDWEPVTYNAWVEAIASPAEGQIIRAIGAIPMDAAAVEWAGDFVFVVDPDVNLANNGVQLDWYGNGGAGRVEWTLLIANGTWDLTHVDNDPLDVTLVANGPISYNDGRLHHVRLVTSDNGANADWEVFFDGVSVGSGTVVGVSWEPLASCRALAGSDAGRVAVGFVAAFAGASPPFNAANAAVVGRSGELAGARFLRLLLEEGIAAEVIGETAGPDTEAMGAQLIDTLAANLAAIEAVDMGLLHGTRHQVGLTYRYRTSLYGQTPVTLDVGAGGQVAPPLEPVIGALGVVNDVTAKREGGSSARSVQETGPYNVNPRATDPDGVGQYPVDLTLLADLDEQLQGLADWRRHRGTVKAVRYPQVTVLFGALAADGLTALAAAVNRLRVGDRVDLANAEPTGVMQIVPGYAETIGPIVALRQITLNGTPANVYEVGVYNAADSRYDSAHSTTAAQITTGTSTSLSVAVAAGAALWVTGSGGPQFPIDINLLGARVRVTAIAGAASPQTFTIDAAVVNGIAKVIPAGTPVRLWSPRRYGL